jgi:Fuc2NAc and GlcNAc transferase
MRILEITSILVIFVLSYIGVDSVRQWCVKRELFDVPNERSSHTVPTPFGGGVVIVVLTLTFYIVYGLITDTVSWAYVFGAVSISMISWFDDFVPIRSIYRFAIHSLAAGVAIFEIGTLQLESFHIESTPWLTIPFTFLWIVWLTNAYNFMDGIDGIAATQAITAGIGWFLFGFVLNVPEISYFGAVLFASNLGFLIHNWSPAKIFMGDVGSAFLGFTFAVIPLMFQDGIPGRRGLIFAICAVALFLIDSIYTFSRRLLKGERVWEAHRTHIFQKLVIKGFSHKFVTLAYGILSLIIIAIYFLRFWIFDM